MVVDGLDYVTPAAGTAAGCLAIIPAMPASPALPPDAFVVFSNILRGLFNMERTYLMVKPDGVQRGLVGEIINRFEKRGFKLVALKMLRISRELAEKHYGEHVGKPFFESLVAFITSGPVAAMVIEGKDAVNAAREMMGATNPLKAAPGTIRGSLGIDIGRNVIHGSDSLESARREISIFFKEEELIDYKLDMESWIYE
jgi:nucleoside-diphosphate kinase